LTIAFLKQTVPVGEPAVAVPTDVTLPALAEGVPLAVALVDRRGRVLWSNPACDHLLAPSGLAVPGQPSLAGQALRDRFAPASAAAVDRLLREAGKKDGEPAGSYILQRRDRNGQTSDLVAYWLTVPLPDGPALLFGFTEDWDALWPIGEILGSKAAKLAQPTADWLTLLLRPRGDVEFWDERWERLTGLHFDPSERDTDLVLDSLFPRQGDRQWVDELFSQPLPRGGQAVLPVESHGDSRPLLCTFLPIPDGDADYWLLLAGDPEVPAGGRSLAARFLRPFARGLIRLLNTYLKEPIELAEKAQERGDVPAPVAVLFDQILESCHRVAPLIAALRDLAADSAGETQLVSLASLCREFLNERDASARPVPYELVLQARAGDAPVRVNQRMIKVVLNHLLTNAEHALLNSARRQIEIRVQVRDEQVRCEIRDSGEGLATADPTVALAPFYSTKGAFAKGDTALASLPATGLGLTVSQHLLDLHGGRLELHSHPDEGTTAVLVLPRGDVTAGMDLGTPPREHVQAERKHPPEE
jgi:signal transduction histidine kinase